MRLAGIYFNDYEVLALAERLRNTGLHRVAARLTHAYHRDAREIEIAAPELYTVILALDEGPDSLQGLREKLADGAAASASG